MSLTPPASDPATPQRVAVEYGELTLAYGTVGDGVFLEFTLPATTRSVRVASVPGHPVPQVSVGEQGRLLVGVDGGAPVEVLVAPDDVVAAESGESWRPDLQDFMEPLRTLADGLSPSLQERIDEARSVDRSCVTHHVRIGAEMGAVVGLIGCAVIGGPLGGIKCAAVGAVGGSLSGLVAGVVVCP